MKPARAFALLVLLSCAIPSGASQTTIDAFLEVGEGNAYTYDGPPGLIMGHHSEPGESYAWDLALEKEYTTFEVRVPADLVDVERARQLVPRLDIPEEEAMCGPGGRTRGPCAYPLFEPVPRAQVWDVDGPVRISNHEVAADGAFVIRLGIPGPVNATLSIVRDVTPPTFTLGPIVNLSHFDFFQTSTTEELALGDLQVRKAGTTEWIQNPTTAYHFTQQYPVQGLDPDTEYEQRFVFHDWAENPVTSEVSTFRTRARPEAPLPTVTPLSPADGERLPREALVVIRAQLESPESPVARDGVRLFFDLKEVPEGFEVADGVLTYTPTLLSEGTHVVRIEVTNAAGGTASERWTFTVGDADGTSGNETPAPGLLAGIVAFAVLAAIRRRG